MPEGQIFRVNRLYFGVRAFSHERTTFHLPRYITHNLLLPFLLGSPIFIVTLLGFILEFFFFLLLSRLYIAPDFNLVLSIPSYPQLILSKPSVSSHLILLFPNSFPRFLISRFFGLSLSRYPLFLRLSKLPSPLSPPYPGAFATYMYIVP